MGFGPTSVGRYDEELGGEGLSRKDRHARVAQRTRLQVNRPGGLRLGWWCR